MTPTLAQVLSTLAHEIRTPLAVSRGYLKLLLDGGLPSAADQRSALERTQEALGVISTLCQEMGKVGAAAGIQAPRPLEGRLTVGGLQDALTATLGEDAPEWRGRISPGPLVATNGTDDIVRAVAALGTMAFKDASGARHVVQARMDDASLVIVIGGEAATSSLPPDPDADGAADVPVVRGGFGLALMWAAFVLEQHRVRTWHHASGRGAVGFLFPLVSA
ncbi:MAG: histidine kinase dimerization/phospho-acceptor domain-containing protein [Vicinamibacterales bacterium]